MIVESKRTSWLYVTIPELIQCIQGELPNDGSIQSIPVSGVGVEIGIETRTGRLFLKWHRGIPAPIGVGGQETPGDAYSARRV